LVAKGIDREIEAALCDRVELPSGGHLNIQPTEALTVIDVNSGRFTSSRTQAETVRRTNLEAAQEISRQLRLRNVGGMVIVDFIDMDSRKDQQQVLEVFQRTLEEDRAKPQVGQLSDLGLVELTRRRQGQSLRELFTVGCQSCCGLGVVPTLVLGTAENKRPISFIKEDEAGARGRSIGRRGARQPSGVYRAATAINGRIVPTVEDSPEVAGAEENLVPIPEHILAQMPDELLNGNIFDRQKRSDFGREPNDGESDPESEEEELSFEPSSEDFALEEFGEQQTTPDEASSKLMQLAESASAVSDMLMEADLSASSATSALATESPERELRLNKTGAHEQAVDQGVDLESPTETEIDPLTGVYRLKVKAEGIDPADYANLKFPGSDDDCKTPPASIANADQQIDNAEEAEHLFEHSDHQTSDPLEQNSTSSDSVDHEKPNLSDENEHHSDNVHMDN
jgi:hypothetical protein